MLWLYGLSTILGGLMILLLVRALCFRPKKHSPLPRDTVSHDREGAVSALQQLVQCRTVSHPNPDMEDDGEFNRLVALLPRLYPKVYRNCRVQELPHRGLLIHWVGRHRDAPSVMMAHYDVVDVEEDQWEKPPFDGIIAEGILWGRGTLDTKATLGGVLWAAETLIGEGFVPQQDIYFAFSGSEEINGDGAKEIVDYFRSHGIQPALVLDEGGAVVEKVFPGVAAPCALIGIGEKGMMNVRFSVHSAGGHASAPPVETPIDILSKACLRLHKHPSPMVLSQPAKALFDTLGRHSGFWYRVIFANLWFFRPGLNWLCRRQGGEINALVRTTLAFTQMEGSPGRNVMPAHAHMVANLRLVPGEPPEMVRQRLERTIRDSRVEVEVLQSFSPSPVSQTHGSAYERVAAAVEATWPGSIVTPYLMVQCADARHYAELSDHVYRFCAMDLTAEERKTIHGNNERIRLDAFAKTVDFYIRLLKTC